MINSLKLWSSEFLELEHFIFQHFKPHFLTTDATTIVLINCISCGHSQYTEKQANQIRTC